MRKSVTQEPSSPQSSLIRSITREIDAHGPVTFARFMELALYHDPDGYYHSAARRPGRGGDFLTAPEMHPLFGIALSRQIAECWERLGRPSPFVIREYGAGVGGLAYDVLAGLLEALPELRPHLRYEMIEVSDYRREDAIRAMVQVGLDDIVVAADRPPTGTMTGVILANEVADALPVHRLLVRNGALRESWVIRQETEGFAWQEGDLSPEIAGAELPRYLRGAGVDLTTLPDGSVIEVSLAARSWIGELAASLARGYALIIDYGYPAAELLQAHRLAGTVRGYTRHTVNDDPFQLVGEQDLTAHVDFSWLMSAAVASGLAIEGLTTQGDFLARIGLGQLLVDMQQQEGITLDVYYRAQAAVYRLIDPGGMGRFRVLGLSRGTEGNDPLTGFVDVGLGL
jgi:SAM-dependent MidA family methyltransferase